MPEELCKCGNKPGTDSENCKDCCGGNKCTYGCETCFCGCHDKHEEGCPAVDGFGCRCGEASPDYPLGGSAEPYDIERDSKLTS